MFCTELRPPASPLVTFLVDFSPLNGLPPQALFLTRGSGSLSCSSPPPDDETFPVPEVVLPPVSPLPSLWSAFALPLCRRPSVRTDAKPAVPTSLRFLQQEPHASLPSGSFPTAFREELRVQEANFSPALTTMFFFLPLHPTFPLKHPAQVVLGNLPYTESLLFRRLEGSSSPRSLMLCLPVRRSDRSRVMRTPPPHPSKRTFLSSARARASFCTAGRQLLYRFDSLAVSVRRSRAFYGLFPP